MHSITRLEDFPNDLFLEIFDYLHTLDLFMAFVSLNQRISTLLFLTPLHVIISKLHSYEQMKFVSSHLTNHVDQIISISLEDQIRDYSGVISYFFNQHKYNNLRSCQFFSVQQTANFNNVIEKLQNLTKLVSFRIIQSKECSLTSITKDNLTRAILTHRFSTLHSINLSFYYDYPDLVTRLVLNRTLTSLHIIFQHSNYYLSIYNFLPILRHYRALRVLRMRVQSNLDENNQQPLLHILPQNFRNNPPISYSMRTFDLTIQTTCTFQSLDFILSCMPNLRRLMVTVIYFSSAPSEWRDLFDGQQWQQILTINTPYLDVFNILLMTDKLNLASNFYAIINSFNGFSRKYSDWYTAIHRLPLLERIEKQQICLRGLRCSKKYQYWNTRQARIVLGMSMLPFTSTIDAPHYLFYSDINHLYCDIPVYRTSFDIQSTVQLFRNVNSLIIALDPLVSNCWEQLLQIFHVCIQMPYIDQDERMEKLAKLIDLTRVTRLEIQPYNNISHQRLIKKLLLACSQLIHLSIGSSLIFSTNLFNSTSLIPVFHRLQSIDFKWKFSFDNASKLILRFPSLIHLELILNSSNTCQILLDIFLDGLSKLCHIKFHLLQNNILDNETSLINYIFQKRCQTFSHYSYNQNEICVKFSDKLIDIYLNGCTICQ